MARQVRIEFAGAVYHVITWGNQGLAILLSGLNRKMFLMTLEEGCAKAGWRVHAYALPDNHYPLLLETPEANLVAGMK